MRDSSKPRDESTSGLVQETRGRSETPAVRIRRALVQQIETGGLRAGDRLPPERELSSLFDTTRITVKEALQSLEAQGLLYCEDRRGWFVAPPRLDYNPLYRSHFHGVAAQQRRVAGTRLLAAGLEIASGTMAQRLGLPALSRVVVVRRVRSLDGRAVMYAEHHLRPERFPDILSHDLTQSLTGLYERVYGIRYGRSKFEIVSSAASGEVAQALALREGSPVLHILRVNYDDRGGAFDCDIEYWRHDAIRIVVDSLEHKP